MDFQEPSHKPSDVKDFIRFILTEDCPVNDYNVEALFQLGGFFSELKRKTWKR